ncbi:MAG: hypothetical protein JSV88_13415, partial [Candidatus Aminicenantes bacterium]
MNKINRFNVLSLFCWVLAGALLCLSNSLNSQANGEKHMKCSIIQKITLAHCARGIRTCPKCREVYTRKYCLLDICVGGNAARPVIEVEINGEKVWREFDIIKVFETYDKAFAYARSHKIPFVKENLELDAVLEKLKNQLPDNWGMRIENERLILERKEPAFEQDTNLINAPAALIKKELHEKETNAKKQGREIYCKFVFQMETRWFPERLAWARNTNQSIDREISQLPDKYNITNLYNRAAKTAEYLYRGKTAEENRRIDTFEKERKELEKKRVRLPDYVSEDYCLFLLEKQGMQDGYTLIYPEEAS